MAFARFSRPGSKYRGAIRIANYGYGHELAEFGIREFVNITID